MIRYLGAAFVLLATTGLGWSMSNDLKSHLHDLRYLKQVMVLLRGEIRYMKTPLGEAFFSVGERLKEPYQSFFRYLSKEIEELSGKSFPEIWSEGVEKELLALKLTKSEKSQLKRIGENLGFMDQAMQLSVIDLYTEQLEGEIHSAEETIGNKTRIYQCLGIMGGIFTVIIIL